MSITWKEFLKGSSWHSSKFIGSDGYRYKFIIGKSLIEESYDLILVKYHNDSFSCVDITTCPTLKTCKKSATLEHQKLLREKRKVVA